MATKKTTRPKATTKRATSTNGKKAAVTKPTTATMPKTRKPMTANEALLIAWRHDYDTRHAKAKSK